MEEKSGNGAFLIILIALFIGGFPWLGFALIALIIFILLLLKIFEIFFEFLAFIAPLFGWIIAAVRQIFITVRNFIKNIL